MGAPDTDVSLPSLGPMSKIIILGAGVFGLSTALWLRKSGYEDITVLDMQDVAGKGYSPSTVDSASADLNKVIRFSYGDKIEYQRLATEAAITWAKWNDELAAVPKEELPVDLKGVTKLWYNSGLLRVSMGDEFSEHELASLENLEKEGLRNAQFRSDDENDLRRAQELGWAHKIDPCQRAKRLGKHKAVLDSTACFVAAHKSCSWARYLAEKSGVKFITHPSRGKALSIETDASRAGAPLVHTADGKTHVADRVIVACGGWTPSFLPEASKLIETTAGSVAHIQLPQDRRDLWDLLAPENFPVINMSGKLGVYCLPRTEDGIFKIACRGADYTNYAIVNGSRVSMPKTANVTDEKETNITLHALDTMKTWIRANLPELTELGISSTRMCWYTDSIDTNFLIDYVPGRPGVFVCSGGSGHGFKFLPILGREVVKILEGDSEPNVYRELWKWRDSGNGLQEDEADARDLSKYKMASEADWAF